MSAIAFPLNSDPLFLYQDNHVSIKKSENPLSHGAIDIGLKNFHTFQECSEDSFAALWKARTIAEENLSRLNYDNRLCYTHIQSGQLPVWQVVAYSHLPRYLDNWITRKIYSIWQQSKVLFHTIFPRHQELELDPMWSDVNTEIADQLKTQTGYGALSNKEVIHRQIVFPSNPLSIADHKILVLYNYAPLKTGGEEMHFLLVPNPEKPAKNFLELDQEQYTELLLVVQKISYWVQEQFGNTAAIHLFDKTGEIAGQTEPLFHTHLIIVQKEEEALMGKISMFLRMLIPSRPLSKEELTKRVSHYRDSLGGFLAEPLKNQQISTTCA